MTLAIGMLNNIFPLHTKIHNYHLKYPTCHAKCHNLNKHSLKKIAYDDEYGHIGN